MGGKGIISPTPTKIKTMTWSRYNEFIQNQDCYSLFNCRTKKWVDLVPELYRVLVENKNHISKLEKIHPSLYKVLVENKFLVPNTECEISECISEIENKLSDSKVMKLTINPTLDCNLRCWYCYEAHLKDSVMSRNTIKATLSYIETTLKKQDYKCVLLSFFGGEPLLQFKNVVKPLLIGTKEICDCHNVEFAISITTNGILLTQRIRDAIRQVTTDAGFQISFDGGKDEHDKTKKFPNGKGSFDIAKNNAREAVLEGFRVTVRCNYTKENVRSFQYLVNEFEDLHSYPNLRFSFHKVWQEPENAELKMGMADLKQAVAGKKFASNMNTYFGDSVNPCYGDFANNYVINYNGDVFKCTARDFCEENRLGKLMDDGEIVFNERALERTRNRWTHDCLTCRRLPICPICSQVKSESIDGKCPVHITPDVAAMNIREYFFDLQTTTV